MALPANDRRCIHTTCRGRRCRYPRLRDSTACLFHSRRTAQLLAHGETLKKRGRLDTAEGIHHFLSRTLQDLAAGEISPARAKALAYVAQTMLASLTRIENERELVYSKEWGQQVNSGILVDAAIDAAIGDGEYADMPAEEAARTAMAQARAKMKTSADSFASAEDDTEDSAA